MKYLKKRNELDLTNKFIIAYGIALGIKYLIEQEICYRDLKPNNILLEKIIILEYVILDYHQYFQVKN